jgi:hypothetical protein
MAEQNKLVNLIGFLINLIIPGLGTIIFGEYELGIVQMVLLISFILVLFSNTPSAVYLVMLIMIAAIWIWALITGIKKLRAK